MVTSWLIETESIPRPPQVRAYSLPAAGRLPPISSGSTRKVPVGFPTSGRRYRVLPHPTLPASVSSSCSLEPGFEVSLPSLRASRQTSLCLR
jgi:hypothetical protein